MIKGIIFDLDNCIFDTSSMGGRAIQGVKDALLSSALPEDTKQAIGLALKTDPLDDVLKRFGVPAEVGEAMRVAYRESDVPEDCVVQTYGDEQYIQELSLKKVLVTSGYLKFQTSKIKRLGIESLFDEVIIDVLDDPLARKGKTKIFEEILHRYGWDSGEVLVVGDNPRSELRSAKELGIMAIQTLRPRIEKWDEADHHIFSFKELQALI